MKKKIFKVSALSFMALALALVMLAALAAPAGAVSYNTIESSTITFQGTLTSNESGGYIGTIPAVVSGFDIYARNGATAIFRDNNTFQVTSGIVSNRDAWPTWTPDTPDWDYYALTFTEDNKWLLVYNENTPRNWADTGAVPMSGTMDWTNMYAAETDSGYCFGESASLLQATIPGFAAANGGGAACWDIDWIHVSEVVPLAFPGFHVTVSEASGVYTVTLTPADGRDAGIDSPGPVVNDNTGESYGNIQSAIDDAMMLDTINVAAGTYNENLIIDESVTLQGADASTTIISSAGDTAITINADYVTIDGFTITNPSGKHGIYAADRSNITITNNTVTNVGTSDATTSGTNFGIGIVSSASAVTGVNNVVISNNEISNIAGGNFKSVDGIAIGWSNGSQDITNLVISDNEISNIYSATVAFSEGGRGANGILINHGADGTGQVVSPQVTGNTINTISGYWAHGIGLEGDTPGAVVENNVISNIIDTKHTHEGIPDAVAIQVEDNASANTVTIFNNSFSNVLLGVWNKTGDSGPNPAMDISGNYWDTTDAADISDMIVDDSGNGVDYSPWLGDDYSADISHSSAWIWYTDDSIQEAVDSAESGDTINVEAGTYNLIAPIVVDESVTIIGDTTTPSNVEIVAPAGVADNDCFQVKANDVTIQGFTMSGAYDSDAYDQNAAIVIGTQWAGAPIIGLNNITISYNDIYDCTRGIYVYRATDVTISNNKIHDIVISGAHASDMWPGKAIELRGDGDPTQTQCHNIDILNNQIYNCQLLGIEVNLWEMTPDDTYVDVDVLIEGNTIYNNGGNWEAVYGSEVYVYRGISCNGQTRNVTIRNNEIYGHTSETNTPDYRSGAIRIDEERDYTITGNNLHDNYKGIRISTSGSGFAITGNTFTDNDIQVDDEDAQALTIETILAGNTFDRAVTVDHPGASLLHTIWSSIQDAVESTDDGDTVNVAAGEYEESVYIESSITLVATEGAEHTFIIGTDDAVIAINGECSVTLDGFDISDAEYGVFMEWVAPFAEINIRNCHIHDTMNGINIGHFVFGGPIYGTFNIQGNIIDSNESGIYASSINDGGTLYIHDNIISENEYPGIYIGGILNESSVTIQGNEITGNSYDSEASEDIAGIYVDYIEYSELDIRDNIIAENAYDGIWIDEVVDEASVTIQGNWITENGEIMYGGIYFDTISNDSEVTIQNNTIKDNNEYGIDNNSEGYINATHNWWGSANGPDIDSNTTTGVKGDKVSDNVIYDPWHLKALEVPETTITDAAKKTTTSVILTWTAEGTWPEDYYDFRYSTSPIDSAATWAAATRITGEPTTVVEGVEQQMIISKLNSNTTYYFGLVITDDTNRSNISTVEVKTDAVVTPDTTPPDAVTGLTASAGEPATTSVKLTWTATGDDGTIGGASKYIIKRSSSPINAANFGAATTIYNNLTPKANGQEYTFTVTKLNPDKDYYFAIQAFDEVDNPSLLSTISAHTAAELPTVTGITADVTGTDNDEARTITITGTNLDHGTAVVRLVKGADVINLTNVTVDGNTQITATVPAGVSPGAYKARVINNNGTSALGGSYTVTQAPDPLPVVTNVIPNMATSGTSTSGVKIFGQHFTGATAVTVDGHMITSFTINNDTKITVTIPALSAGEYDVRVTTPAGTNDISAVKFIVSDPVTATGDDTTTSGIVDLGDTGGTTEGQITLTTDNSANATQNTDADVEIEVVIPPDTSVTDSNGDPYTGTLNPPRVVKPDLTEHPELTGNEIVIEMGNPEQRIDFSQPFVATVTVTGASAPQIYYYDKENDRYDLAGINGEKDGTTYVRGGVVLNTESISETENIYTIGLLLNHMSTYVASNESLLPEPTPAPAPAPGGGGGAAPVAGTTNIRGSVSSTGRFTERIVATTDDRVCSITIPVDTVGLDKDLKPLTKITMLPLYTPPALPGDWSLIGLAYDFGPGGASFDPAVTLSWKYKPGDLPADISPEDLALAFYNADTGKWVLLDSTVDTINHIITAKITHFSTFALIGVPKAAAFTVSSLNISPAEVKSGETATVTATVTNTGDSDGSYSIVLLINGVKEAEKSVTIAAGGSQDVSFNVVKESAGTYSVELNGLKGSFTVTSEPAIEPTKTAEPEPEPEPIQETAPPATTPAPTQAETPEPQTNWALIWGVIALGVVIIGTSVVLWLRRRRA